MDQPIIKNKLCAAIAKLRASSPAPAIPVACIDSGCSPRMLGVNVATDGLGGVPARRSALPQIFCPLRMLSGSSTSRTAFAPTHVAARARLGDTLTGAVMGWNSTRVTAWTGCKFNGKTAVSQAPSRFASLYSAIAMNSSRIDFEPECCAVRTLVPYAAVS